MKKTLKIGTAAFVIALLCLTCSKPPDYPIEPIISFISFDKTDLKQGVDTVYVKIAFTDGDGDLGLNIGDTSKNLYLIDPRFADEKETFLFPFVPEQGVGNGIKGEATIRVQATCCRYLGCGLTDADHPYDSISYQIKIRDRAGHFSNTIKLPPLRLKCDKAY
ncbi:MAG: hypothetical protein RI894_2546 [Bacteroidota bacterium]|jgi:hypothetical protein